MPVTFGGQAGPFAGRLAMAANDQISVHISRGRAPPSSLPATHDISQYRPFDGRQGNVGCLRWLRHGKAGTSGPEIRAAFSKPRIGQFKYSDRLRLQLRSQRGLVRSCSVTWNARMLTVVTSPTSTGISLAARNDASDPAEPHG
jgi:hypothetical protein